MSAPSAALLGPDDPPPFTIRRPAGRAPVLLACDHAGRAVPRALDRLGLDEAALSRHIAWDIGAAAVTRLLAAALDAPAVLGGFSRLVIDCNRDPADPTSIPTVSDGVTIPRNHALSAADRAARAAAIFRPYHAAIAARLDEALAEGIVPAFIAIHSFTPAMSGVARPWHVGVLWDEDPRLPVPLLEALRAEPGLVVGDNQPYSAREPAGYTVRRHAERRGLAHVAVELRQDLVADAAGAAEWAGRLAAALRPILARPEVHRAGRARPVPT